MCDSGAGRSWSSAWPRSCPSGTDALPHRCSFSGVPGALPPAPTVRGRRGGEPALTAPAEGTGGKEAGFGGATAPSRGQTRGAVQELRVPGRARKKLAGQSRPAASPPRPRPPAPGEAPASPQRAQAAPCYPEVAAAAATRKAFGEKHDV